METNINSEREPKMENKKVDDPIESFTTEKNSTANKFSRTTSLKLLEDDSLAEMIINEEGWPKFAVFKNYSVSYENAIILPDATYRPWSAKNNLIVNGAIKFPSKAEDFGSPKELFDSIKAYMKKYVVLSEVFYDISAVYVMATWLYEQFHDVAYLRVIGVTGTGKSRFIQTVGGICYKPMIVSGSSSPSALFRMIDSVGGTFVFDEADFKNSELWSELVKVLNSGHTQSGYVLRSEKEGKDGEFKPRAFKTFGPKVIASRTKFNDDALESRCIAEELVPKSDVDVPIQLPPYFEKEALNLRNKLLMFRFRNYKRILNYLYQIEGEKTLDPRMKQTSFSILSVASLINDRDAILRILNFLREYNEQLKSDRGDNMDVDVLLCVAKLMLDPKCRNSQDDYHSIREFNGVKVGFISDLFNRVFNLDYDIQTAETSTRYIKNNLTPKKAGEIVRNKLRIKTRRQKHGYVIPLSEQQNVQKLMERYGLTMADIKTVDCGVSHRKQVNEVEKVEEAIPF